MGCQMTSIRYFIQQRGWWVTYIVIFILFITILSLIFLQQHIQFTKKLNQDAIDLFENLILHAQKKDGILVVPDFLYLPNEMFRSHDMLRHLKGKNKIKKIIYEGHFPPKFDQESLSYVLSLKDLNEIDLSRIRLEGHLFNHPTPLPPIKIITINRSDLDKKGYQDLISIDTLDTLKILSPCTIISEKEGTSLIGISNIECQEIVNILSTATNLKHLLLDELFTPWENELKRNLSNTDVQILRSYEIM
jgi:hypothetical protein